MERDFIYHWVWRAGACLPAGQPASSSRSGRLIMTDISIAFLFAQKPKD